jgi:F-box/leucine-rich repeat protein 2/20
LLPTQTLSHCELITDDGIRQLAAGSCAAESLSVLELDNCPLITDATLEHLTSCHNLQRIELYDCQLISRNAIRKLRVNIDMRTKEVCWYNLTLCFQTVLPNIKVHAYFAPVTPPVGGIIAGMFVNLRYIDVFIQSALDNTEFSDDL